MHGDPVGEIGECGMKHKCVADTVQKMQERFSGEMYNYGDSIDTDTAEELINQISKEMLEENK